MYLSAGNSPQKRGNGSIIAELETAIMLTGPRRIYGRMYLSAGNSPQKRGNGSIIAELE